MKMLRYALLAALCAVLMSAAGCKKKAEETAAPAPEKIAAEPAVKPALPCNNPYDAKVVFSGPGGHSNGAYGRANAIHAAGTAVESMFLAEAPAGVTFNVNTLSGGNSVNSIASGATLIVESCADTPEASAEFVKFLDAAVNKGAASENAFRGVQPGQTDAAGVRMDIRTEISKI